MARFGAAVFALALLLLPISAGAQLLQVDGRQIVDDQGNAVLLRGLGLGGWLVPEGYMLRMPGYGSPTSIREDIVDLIGEAGADRFYAEYRKNYVARRDIDQIANWGFNSIRLPLHYKLFTPTDNIQELSQEGFAIVDSMLAWCEANQLYLILDMHAAPGGQNGGNISDSDGTARLWTDPANQDLTVDIWRAIAERYAGEPWIGGYDLLNEPVLPDPYTNLDLRNLYRRIATAIREVDADHILFIEGNWYATYFDQLTPPLIYGQNIVYAFHMYWGPVNLAAIRAYTEIRKQWNVPIWLGETGENSNPWFYDAVRLMEDNDIGWNWWTHKKIGTTTSPLSAVITPGYQKILDYLGGSAPRPSQTEAEDALLGMAANLALNRCETRPGVLPALLDPDFGTTAKPVVDNVVPGLIDCADYDLGGENVAYADKDSRLTTGLDNWMPWNTGGAYRNDGVDIEPSQDNAGAPFSIGWTEPGEWLRYTIDVETAGIYEVQFRVASATGGGSFSLELNEAPLMPALSVGPTGGWYNWRTTSPEMVTLPAGRHELKLRFLTAGVNINQMDFVLKIASDVSDDLVPGPEFALERTFPNPFKNTTTVRLQLQRPSAVSLAIVDVLGRTVKEQRFDQLATGEHNLEWDGRDAGGRRVAPGVYFVRLKAGTQSALRKIVLSR